MNRYAYRTTGLAIQTLSGLSKAQVRIHGKDRLAQGPGIFVVNHFTRIETLLLPYHIHRLTGAPVWSLAADELFTPALSAFLDRVGVVSTRDPHRDLLMVKSILAGEASWIIYPEGRMVKNKKIMERGRLMIVHDNGKHPPHTGAAALALRCEFYRQRIRALTKIGEDGEVRRILGMFGIEAPDVPARHPTQIIPVNITYYPLRARENALTRLAGKMKERLSDRMMEELATEGSMVLRGVDVDVRIGPPLAIAPFLRHPAIKRDIAARRAIGFDDVLPSRRAMQRAAAAIMQTYMQRIYNMTTVNHDHLFAAMLRALPRRRIFEADLRRRVFLASGQRLADTGVHCHQSLGEGQEHLLTDDRYGKVAAFLSMAAETGVVTGGDGGMLRCERVLGAASAFHRVRVDNPVAVMVNEIEPLDRLRALVRRIAWLPSWWVRRRVVRRLTQKALDEYDADYDRFHRPGESKGRSVGSPFFVRGRSLAMGVVLVHGYMAAPGEVRGLAEYLGRCGFWVYVPRLRGHGTAPEDLAIRSYKDWIESVDNAYAVVSSLCRRVVVGGFSTGAGLALDLAARIKGIDGVFAVSPPLRLQDFSARFAPAVDVWNRLMKKVGLAGAGMEFIENQPENPHINYFRNPISGIRELERLMDTLPPRLARIDQPALVVQSQLDPVVNPEGSKQIFDRLGSVDKTYTLFNIDRHGILLGPGAEQVYKTIGEFVARL